jgi:penicillin-binding protein-related factor A (putative recombinase)
MYIKEYSEFLSKTIDYSEYSNYNIIDFTNKEINIIHSIKLKNSIHLNMNYLPKQISFGTSSFTETIFKIEDEWYLIKRETLHDEYYYKIDGFDGLLDYINKYFAK